MAAGHRAGQPQHGRRGHRPVLRAWHARRPDLTQPHPGQADGLGRHRRILLGQRRRAAGGDREVGAALPAPGPEPVAVADGGADLAERQPGRRGSRRILRGVRQPDAGGGGPGNRPAELGLGRQHLSVADARLGRRPGGRQPGLDEHHLGRPGRAGPPALAPGRQRVHAPARGLGPVPRARRGGDQVLRRGLVDDRRRLAAEPLGQRPSVRRLAGGGRSDRVRQQRRAGQWRRPGCDADGEQRAGRGVGQPCWPAGFGSAAGGRSGAGERARASDPGAEPERERRRAGLGPAGGEPDGPGPAVAGSVPGAVAGSSRSRRRLRRVVRRRRSRSPARRRSRDPRRSPGA